MDLDITGIRERITNANEAGAFSADDVHSFGNMIKAAEDNAKALMAIKARLDPDIWDQFISYPADLRPCRSEGHLWPRWKRKELPPGTFAQQTQFRTCPDCQLTVERRLKWTGEAGNTHRDQSQSPDYRIPGANGENRLSQRDWNALNMYERIIHALELAERRAGRRSKGSGAGGTRRVASHGHLRAVS